MQTFEICEQLLVTWNANTKSIPYRTSIVRNSQELQKYTKNTGYGALES